MTDIEDIVPVTGRTSVVSESAEGAGEIALIRKNFKKNQLKNRPFDRNSLEKANEEYGNVPGAQKIYVKTFGCSHNISDSEFMMGQLVDYGYQLTEDPVEADLILLNSCTVKNPSQEGLLRMVFEAETIKKPIVVAGCVSQGDQKIPELNGVSIIGISQIDRVIEVVEETLRGNSVRLLEKAALPSLDLPKIRKNQYIEILAINTGCLGNCTYCKTKHARGHLGSYRPEEILRRVDRAVEEGVKEIWLTSEDTGAYGRDIGTDIGKLLVSIVERLPKTVMLRIGMTNPPYIKEHLQTIAIVLLHPQVFEFLHIPIQSGSDEVLEKMNREYTVQDFEEVCDYLMDKVPNLMLGTDIICGFPGESSKDHQETLSVIKKYQFPVVNISQFYPRPGTIAAKMKQINSKIKKERSREVTQVFNEYRFSSLTLGSEHLVWISEKEIVKEKEILVGHTKGYCKVVLSFEEGLLGTCVLVRIVECRKWDAEGHVIDRRPEMPPIPIDYFTQIKEKWEKEEREILSEQINEEIEVDKAEPSVGLSAERVMLWSSIGLVSVALILKFIGK